MILKCLILKLVLCGINFFGQGKDTRMQTENTARMETKVDLRNIYFKFVILSIEIKVEIGLESFS